MLCYHPCDMTVSRVSPSYLKRHPKRIDEGKKCKACTVVGRERRGGRACCICDPGSELRVPIGERDIARATKMNGVDEKQRAPSHRRPSTSTCLFCASGNSSLPATDDQATRTPMSFVGRSIVGVLPLSGATPTEWIYFKISCRRNV